MLLKETLLFMKTTLKKFFVITNARSRLSPSLEEKVKLFEADIELGIMDEPRFERLLGDLITELDEHMFMWQRAINGRANDFIHQGPQYLLILTAPNIKTCISDIISLKHLLMPPSYNNIQVVEEGDKVFYKMIRNDAETPIADIKDDTLIALCLFIFREICGSDFDYTELWIPTARQHFKPDIISLATKAKINFHDAPMMAVFNKSDYLKINELYDGGIRAVMQKAIALKSQKIKQESTFTDKVINILMESDKPASLHIENVAAQLNTSTSTFRRNVAEENTSFKELQGKVVDQQTFDNLLLSDIKIDAIAYQLGYTERSSFERAFRNKFGTTPANLRAYKNRLVASEGVMGIQKLINTLPPLPESCRLLIKASESEQFELSTAVNIIEKDSVFTGRIMGLANKAIYGRSPRDLTDAIGRNIGLASLKNLAVVFAASESLENDIIDVDLLQFIKSQIMTPDIFRIYSKNILVKKSQQEAFDQILMFGLLGLLILFHKQFNQNQQVIEMFKTSHGLIELMTKMRTELNVSLLGTTALLLTMWGLNAEIIRHINQLENKLANNKPLNQADNVILISFSSSLALCLELDFKAEIQVHSQQVSKINFEDSWSEVEEIIKQY